MEEFQSITRFYIESKLTNKMLSVPRIISSAMVLGAAIFSIIIFYLYSKNPNEDFVLPEVSQINTLIYVLIALGLLVYSAFFYLPNFLLNPQYLKNRLTKGLKDNQGNAITDPIDKLLNIDLTFMIVRLAMLESIALFAMVILFLAASNGQLNFEPSLWLLLLPLVIQAAFTFNNYLPKIKYVDRIETKILAPLKEQQLG